MFIDTNETWKGFRDRFFIEHERFSFKTPLKESRVTEGSVIFRRERNFLRAAINSREGERDLPFQLKFYDLSDGQKYFALMSSSSLDICSIPKILCSFLNKRISLVEVEEGYVDLNFNSQCRVSEALTSRYGNEPSLLPKLAALSAHILMHEVLIIHDYKRDPFSLLDYQK